MDAIRSDALRSVPPGPLPVETPGSHAAGRARAVSLREVALWAHRYVGLSMTVFLVVAGLTGSVLAFYHELDPWLSPGLYRSAPPTPGALPLDPFAQREALQRQLPPGLLAQRVSFEQHPERVAPIEVSAAPGAPAGLDDEFFLDPYTGRVLGSRRWGDIGQGVRNVLPFLYRLHYSLALGEVGVTLFGVVALLWTIDCFIGGYLTLPVSQPRGRRGLTVWLGRWKPAWLVRAGQLFSLVFTWHRASGLWVWGLLLVFAWSGVGLNLRGVYNPVMAAAFGSQERTYARLGKLDPPRPQPELDWREAHRLARAAMAEQAARQGFAVLEERRLVYHPEIGAFRYQVQSSLDVSDRYPDTTLWLSARDGRWLGLDTPTGQNAGLTLTTWLYQLHFGAVNRLGLPYRVLVSLLGLAIAALSVTGAWVWWVKRAKRRRQRPRALRAQPSSSG
jgi:uncharacterized iron-regulated membrane protein